MPVTQTYLGTPPVYDNPPVAAPGGTMTAAAILTSLKTVDGAGSGLDADTVDGAAPGDGSNPTGSGAALTSLNPTNLGTGSGAVTIAAGGSSQSVKLWPSGPLGVVKFPDAAKSSYNITAGTLKNWRAAVAKVRAGSGDGKILVLGDSTMTGYLTGLLSSSPPTRLAGLLNSYSVTAKFGSTFGALNTGIAAGTFDPRVVLGTGWGAGGFGLGDGYSAATSAAGNLSFTPLDAFDRIVVYAAVNPGLGTSAINVDGGSSLGNIVTADSPGIVGVFPFSCSLGTHTINILPPTVNTIYIIGVEVYTSTTKSVRIYNGSYVGAKTSRFYVSTDQWSPYNCSAAIAPNLTIVNLVVNDSGQTGTTTLLATYLAQLSAIVVRAQQFGDCLLVVGNPSSSEGVLQDYRDICYQVADTYGAGLIDLKARWQSYAISNPLGLYGDGIHPNTVGDTDIASAIFNVLRDV